ncbi:hypothetical protein Micbo1qcDRAFT_177471 [Microdochium bolleyi]|uniref:Uncharacterized protein n=1 Tax=Microdochium bolleyi TaxID=196109 RepID=A0A136IW26_9PEZI|nr:hypothetical protein Micbo1qcDRAFT_177471 [Microdochium bolleyi]
MHFSQLWMGLVLVTSLTCDDVADLVQEMGQSLSEADSFCLNRPDLSVRTVTRTVARPAPTFARTRRVSTEEDMYITRGSAEHSDGSAAVELSDLDVACACLGMKHIAPAATVTMTEYIGHGSTSETLTPATDDSRPNEDDLSAGRDQKVLSKITDTSP